MSDPFSDPNASPWTRGGDPVSTEQGQHPPPGGDPWQAPPPAGSQPSDADGWSQPPGPPAAHGQPQWGTPPDQPQWDQQPQWGTPPDQPQWDQQPQWDHLPQWGQQPRWDQQPRWGQAPAGQPWGQSPYGQPPQQSSATRVVWIVVGVVAVLIIAAIAAAAIAVSAFRDDFSGFVEEVGDLEQFDDAAGVPEGARLLQTSGSVGEDGSQQFQFTVADRTNVQIDVIGRDDFDPLLTLRDQDGGQLAEDDDGGQGLDSRISIELGSGTYTVDVRGWSGRAGSFEAIVTDR